MTQICKICSGNSTTVFVAEVLSKYQVSYFQCDHCKFIQTETPYWLDESYKSAINVSDTGIILRNEIYRRIVTTLFYYCFNNKAKFLDFAGGYGIFTRMMRDIGFDYYWVDTYAQNLVSRGFEHTDGNNYEAVTAFEVFEHMVNPLQDVETMLQYSDTIVFSTVLLPDNLPPQSWWYWDPYNGQHIAFYNKKSLEEIAKRYNLHLLTNGANFHMLTRKKISQLYFNILVKLSKYGLNFLAKQFLSSKTKSDFNYFNKR